MGGIFGGGGSAPAPAPVSPYPPGQSPKELAAQDAAADLERRQRAMGGRASTFFTSPDGDTSAPTLATHALLGT